MVASLPNWGSSDAATDAHESTFRLSRSANHVAREQRRASDGGARGDLCMTESEAAAKLERDDNHCLVMGFDYSEGAEIALDHALSMVASLPTATLHVVWVLPASEIEARPRAAATRKLRAYVASRVRFLSNRLGPRTVYGGVQIRVHVLVGSPAQVLNDVAFRERAHLLVVGCHGRAGLERIVLGCVAADVLAAAPCPVVVARPRAVDHLPRRRGRLPDALAVRQAPASAGPLGRGLRMGRPTCAESLRAESRPPEDAS